MLRWKLILVLVKKDIEDVFKSKNVLVSLFFLPFMFSILIPYLMIGLPASRGRVNLDQSVQFFVKLLPPLTANWAALDLIQKYFIILSFFPTIFLVMLGPLLPSIIASESIAGEKERQTLESLLATPLTESELLLGKIISSLVPSLLIVWLFSVPYVLLIDFYLYPILGFFLFPDLRFIFLMFVMAPLLTFASVVAMIWISLRVKVARDAQQLSVLIVMPLILFLMIEVLGAIFFDIFLILGTLGFVFLDLVLYQFLKSSFNREKLLSKL